MIEMLDCDIIRAILPHRYPMLLVDRILELEPGKRAVGIKNVTMNENFFTGHFPDIAVMPGVLVVEAMAQVAGIMMLTCEQYRGKIPFIASIDAMRYYHPVVPGDTLTIEAKTVWVRAHVGKVDFLARVGTKIVAKGEMKFALKEPPPPAISRFESLGIYAGAGNAESRESEHRV